CSAQNAHAAGPEDQGDRGETQKFYSGIEQCVRKDRVTPGKHVVAVAAFEFRYCLWFAIEQLHHVHSRNVFLQEYISGMHVVQLFNREPKAIAEFERRNRDNMLAWRDAILAYALFYPAVEFLSFATIALIFWAGGMRILGGT